MSDQRTDILSLRLALAPFVREFLEQKRMTTKSRRDWFDVMPDKFPIKLKMTMGECRAAFKALEESREMDETNENT